MHDFFRFWWELLALNGRKTVFRVRGARGPAPCQAENDSGRAGETHCEACALWDKPGRFRRVCPALAWTKDGWRCSVNAADVRPYWRRAWAYFGGTAAALYLVVTLGAFGVLRGIGYGVRYADVMWPPAWGRFHLVRSQYYLERGRAALAENRIGEANLSLSMAFDYDPTNYEVGLMLAQLWQAGQTGVSDRVYARLLVSHPARAAETARGWGQALLWRGDFALLGKLAAERLAVEPPPATAWVNALIFSARQRRDATLLAAVPAEAPLSAETRSLLRLERMAWQGDAEGRVRLLMAPLNEDASAYARYYQISGLIAAGEARRALELLTRYGAKLPADERVGLTLGAQAKLGEVADVRRQALALLEANPKPQMYEVLAAHLVRHYDAELLRTVVERLAALPWAGTEAGLPAHAALLCAAGLAGDGASVATLRTRMRRVTRAPLRALDRAEDFLSGRGRMGHFAPSLPMLPLETVYALFEAEAERIRRKP